MIEKLKCGSNNLYAKALGYEFSENKFYRKRRNCSHCHQKHFSKILRCKLKKQFNLEIKSEI